MNITKAVFFDVDGTLLPLGSKTVPQSTLNAITKLKAKGIFAVVATGRQIDSYSKLPVNSIDFDAYIVANGTMLLDKNRKFIDGTPMEKQNLRQVLNLLDEEKIAYALTTLEGRYINFIDETVIKTHNQVHTKPPKIGLYQGEDVYMIEAYLPQDRTQLLKRLQDFCTVTRWHESGVDMFSKAAGKAVGIEKFQNLHNLIKEEIIAFGDAENDIQMLLYAGTGVAMGNADQCVKDIADYITDTVENNGVENALIRLGVL